MMNKLAETFDAWFENPNGGNKARLVALMAQISDAERQLGLMPAPVKENPGLCYSRSIQRLVRSRCV